MSEDRLGRKPQPLPADDPRLGFHADANPIRGGQPELYGLDLFKAQLQRPRLSSEPDK